MMPYPGERGYLLGKIATALDVCSMKVLKIGAGILKKAPIIDAIFLNPTIMTAHLQKLEILEYPNPCPRIPAARCPYPTNSLEGGFYLQVS